MFFDRPRLFNKKHIERTRERITSDAEALREWILKLSDGKIPSDKAELMAYKRVAMFDYDNVAAMSVPMDVHAELMVKNYLENHPNTAKQKSEREYYLPNDYWERPNMKWSDNIYFARSSFCMADDVTAPNAKRYVIRKPEYCSVLDIHYCLQDYFRANLPQFHWRGYCAKRRFVDIFCKYEGDNNFVFNSVLADNWKELLGQEKTVYFKNYMFDEDDIPECLEEDSLEDYTAEELEALLNEDEETFDRLIYEKVAKHGKA